MGVRDRTTELLRGAQSRRINHRLDQLWMTDAGFDAIGSLRRGPAGRRGPMV